MVSRLSVDASLPLKELCISTATRVTVFCVWGEYGASGRIHFSLLHRRVVEALGLLDRCVPSK
jgi:hypothetical protein